MSNFFSYHILFILFFFFNDTATTEIYTLSLHDALPIPRRPRAPARPPRPRTRPQGGEDRKSTRLNSSHRTSSYAVFCLKKKKNTHFNKTKKIEKQNKCIYTTTKRCL